MFQAPTGSGGGFTVLLLQMAAIGLVFYFLILRPSGQARKKHAELLTNLKKGDEVMTSGGLIGKVSRVIDERELLVEIADNVKVRIARTGIADVRAKGEPARDEAAKS